MGDKKRRPAFPLERPSGRLVPQGRGGSHGEGVGGLGGSGGRGADRVPWPGLREDHKAKALAIGGTWAVSTSGPTPSPLSLCVEHNHEDHTTRGPCDRGGGLGEVAGEEDGEAGGGGDAAECGAGRPHRGGGAAVTEPVPRVFAIGI